MEFALEPNMENHGESSTRMVIKHALEDLGTFYTKGGQSFPVVWILNSPPIGRIMSEAHWGSFVHPFFLRKKVRYM